MSTITLENVRATSDITIKVRLKDGGLAIDWSGMSEIKAWIFSDAQKALAGRCVVSVDQEDDTLLLCEYAATKPQYLGVNRIVVQCRYNGRLKTYDKPAFNLVARTAELAGDQIVLDDPVVDVAIEVQDVSSSILDTILAACIRATEEAQQIVDTSRGPRGYSAYEIAVQDGFVGTEEQWLESLIGPAGKSAYQEAVDNGFVGTESQWLASLVGPTGKSAYQSALDNGFVGSEADWLASLVGPQGLSAYQVAVEAGFEGSVSDWLASLVGPAGPPCITSVEVSVDNNVGTPAAVATIINQLLSIAFSNLKGNPGQSAYQLAVALGYSGTEEQWIASLHGAPGVGLDSVSTPVVVDGTLVLALTDGSTVTIDLNHNHTAYPKYQLCTDEAAYTAITTKESDKLYLIPEV